MLYCNTGSGGIIKIDLKTNGTTPTGVSIPGTAFGYGGDGFWYANGGDDPASGSELWRLLPEDPLFAPELVGAGARIIEDLATAPDGTMYGVGEGILFTINKATGTQSDIGGLGFVATGLSFDDLGRLVTMSGTEVLELNLATGASTFVVDLGETTTDLASHPGVFATAPALSPWGVVIASLLLMSLLAMHRHYTHRVG